MVPNIKQLLCSSIAISMGFLFAAPAARAQGFTPPAASAPLLKGIDFSKAKPIGERFSKRFKECDTKDTCEGAVLRFGCSRDKNNNRALLSLADQAILFDAK